MEVLHTMHPESGFQIAQNWPKIWKMTMTSQFSDIISSSNIFDVVLFLLSNLVTGPSFIPILSLVLELWQFSFIRDWPEIRKSEITSSEFCPIEIEIEIRNLAPMSLIKCYSLLQNARVTAYTLSELLRGKTTPPPLPIRVKYRFAIMWNFEKLLCFI